ncbi:NADH-ubiquinone oxidoreductase-F iron-sulfur binding region domain-containing protein [Gryllotalpicola sp.]|uniref:NADH-ubiquinone oxidoreductase-F iron-sulfur binding region domain-containing protein n=1 Tax=Gryllotalpicola sp. TaxID=1932787 RepID=UPI00260DCB17|nr:NADH-ubiquinone oxidoreductase-F iron-sulfur binding region domain-containing protein [Gryllotalpicola sp.]
MTTAAVHYPQPGQRVGLSPAPIPPRLLAAGHLADLATHLATFGAFDPRSISSTLLPELERSGLTGRGGAAFPAWRKLMATADADTSKRPVVIANGAEGEPASRKDAVLLRNAPHLVIDGILATAAAVGAHRCYLYAGRDGLEAVAAAIDERRAAGGGGAKEAARIQLLEAPDAFVSGEATAVVNAIERGLAVPRDHVAHLSTAGLAGRPTLLHNVETLAHIALIARYGSEWFRSAGTVDDPGTRLVTVSGDLAQTRVLEVPGGMPVDEILRLAGWDPDGLRAVLVGGYHGAWIAAEDLSVPMSRQGLAAHGASPGAGILVTLAKGRCGIAATAEIIDYLASQSAGQCGPCRFGLPALASTWRDLASGVPDPSVRTRLAGLAIAVNGRGACAHPDGTVRLSRSAARVFADDLEQHTEGHCLHAARRSAS